MIHKMEVYHGQVWKEWRARNEQSNTSTKAYSILEIISKPLCTDAFFLGEIIHVEASLHHDVRKTEANVEMKRTPFGLWGWSPANWISEH